MKNIPLLFALFLMVSTAFGQSEKFIAAMQPKVSESDTTSNPVRLSELSAAFERIADAEKTQWLPYYYAALTKVNEGYVLSQGKTTGGMASTIDPIADKAEGLLNKAEALSKDNAEIYLVKKMIAFLRMVADPMTRYMQQMPLAGAAMETAKKLNAENPRIYLLEGQDKFFTPEQYGGSKTEAKALFEQALKKFETFKPATALDPNWGKPMAEYYLRQVKG
ncbi:MAG: hypothetical protein ACM3VS_00680 [Candidatus Dadabacteria bacterium]